jgi:hypothetical protein
MPISCRNTHTRTSTVPKDAWLLAQLLPEDESAAIERHIREYDRLTDDLQVV